MKYTLLKLVQHVLSDMDGDEVNDIFETVESAQVVSIAERMFFEVIAEHDLQHTEGLVQLEPSLDIARPTHMRLPDNVEKVMWVKYDVRDPDAGDTGPVYREMCWLPPKDFCERIANRVPDEHTIQVTDPSGVTFHIRNDRRPHFYTSFDDEHLVFDAYDVSLESTLQNSKTFVHARTTPGWSNENSFIPDLPTNLWPRYVNAVLSRCFHVLKQQPNASVDRAARRLRVKAQRDRFRNREHYTGVDFGRKGPRSRSRVNFHRS